jgi:hypothetical protein
MHSISAHALRQTFGMIRSHRAVCKPDVQCIKAPWYVRCQPPRRAAIGKFTCRHAAAVPLISGQAVPTGTKRVGAVNSSTSAAASTVSVAVVDTGVQLDHPDLNVVAGVNCINELQPPEDDDGHGTHCAGIIGAKNDAGGVIGVAPGTRIVAVKVC